MCLDIFAISVEEETIFEMVFEDEPSLLEQKQQEIGQAALIGRRKNQKLLV